MDAKDAAGERKSYEARRSELAWSLAQAESAVHGASLGLIRQQKRLGELRGKEFASEARQAQAEFEMLDDLRRRRVLERDDIARELAQMASRGQVPGDDKRELASENEPPIYGVEPTEDDPQTWRIVGPNGGVDAYRSEREAQRKADDMNAQIAEEREGDA